jgi:Glyoxalase-like domain
VRKPRSQAKVAELLERGATVRHTSDDADQGFCSTVMFDPEDNEFCVA